MNGTIRIVKLTLQETGTYNPIFDRPFQSNIDGMILDQLNERLYNNTSNSVGEGIMSGFANVAIAPSATPGKLIDIPNGWNESRIRFVLTLEHTNPNGGTSSLYYYQGFTDYNGITMSGVVDPQMTFYINSFVRVSRVPHHGDAGIEWVDSVVESAQILNDALVMDKYDQGYYDPIYTARPADVFSAIQSSHIEAGYNINTIDGEVPFNDGRTMFNDAMTNNRVSNNPSSYLSNLLNSYKLGLNVAEYGQDGVEILDRSSEISVVNESSLVTNPLFRTLSGIQGHGNGISFKFGDLEAIDPNIVAVTDSLITMGNTSLLHHTGDTAYWNTATHDAQIATILANAVPGVMLECFIGNATFRATNLTSDMHIEVQIIDITGITLGLSQNMINRFVDMLTIKVLSNLSNGGQEGYAITVSASIYGDTTVSLQLDGQPTVVYTLPTFCDSMITPILNTDKPTHYNLVNEVESLLQSTKDSLMGPSY